MCDKQEQFVTQTLLTNLKQFVKVLMANKILILNALRMIIQVKIYFGLRCIEKCVMEKIFYNYHIEMEFFFHEQIQCDLLSHF